MQFLTYKGYLVMGHGILKVFYKSLTSLLQVSYKSLTGLLQVSFKSLTSLLQFLTSRLQVSHKQRSWVMVCGGHGSWGRGHGVGVMG